MIHQICLFITKSQAGFAALFHIITNTFVLAKKGLKCDHSALECTSSCLASLPTDRTSTTSTRATMKCIKILCPKIRNCILLFYHDDVLGGTLDAMFRYGIV